MLVELNALHISSLCLSKSRRSSAFQCVTNSLKFDEILMYLIKVAGIFAIKVVLSLKISNGAHVHISVLVTTFVFYGLFCG